jgi:GNAT superfamily N-acetyltransferase
MKPWACGVSWIARLTGRVADPGGRFTTPVVLDAEHDPVAFSSGETVLDDWLRDRALENIKLGASRTYVTCLAGSRVVAGFYALAMGSILGQDVPGGMRRNMPRVIPAVVLGRLAVDQQQQGHGLGAILLRDAVMRGIRAAGDVSARLMIVHALNTAAEAFYLKHGFTRLPGDAPTLALDLVKFASVMADQTKDPI